MHHVHPYLTSSPHPITVDLLGAGGTGSMLLTHLARLHLTLQARGLMGLHVRVFDPDHVERPNLVRQHFTRHDLNRNKATVAVERLNAFYGLRWEAVPLAWDEKWVQFPSCGPFASANITITCVDSASARMEVDRLLQEIADGNEMWNHDGSLTGTKDMPPTMVPLYWLDMGNGRSFGQVCLSSWLEIPQPGPQDLTNFGNWPKPAFAPKTAAPLFGEPEEGASYVGRLPSLSDRFGALEQYDDDQVQGPSCSLLQALERQSLMVNPMVATHAASLLCDLFSKQIIERHGCFINLDTLTTTPLLVEWPQARPSLAA